MFLSCSVNYGFLTKGKPVREKSVFLVLLIQTLPLCSSTAKKSGQSVILQECKRFM
jgi:hypothetical protein